MVSGKSTEICTLPYVDQMTRASWVHEAGHPKPLQENPEGWGREGGGRGLRMRGTYVHLWLSKTDVRRKPSQNHQVIIP